MLWLLPVFFLVALVLYGNVLDAPFQFDDRQLLQLADPSLRWYLAGNLPRMLTNLSFALDYELHGADVVGYHLVNVVIHAGTAYLLLLLLYTWLKMTSRPEPPRLEAGRSPALPDRDVREEPTLPEAGRSPALPGGADRAEPPRPEAGRSPALPDRDAREEPARLASSRRLLAAALPAAFFLCHPLATQAVTYISQRATGMATFFYLAALLCYTLAAQARGAGAALLSGRHLAWYGLAVAAGVAALLTKEFPITLPVIVVLVEWFVIRRQPWPRRLAYVWPLLLVGALGFWVYALRPLGETAAIAALPTGMREQHGAIVPELIPKWGPETVSRAFYLRTQLRVIVTVYLKLSFVPWGQNLDHFVPGVDSWRHWVVPVCGGLLTVLLAGGAWLLRRQPLLGLGLVWFVVTLGPTSSIITNSEFVAEHRAYLPLIGVCLALAWAARRATRPATWLAVGLPVLAVLGTLTVCRNQLWQSELALWSDAMRKSPTIARPCFMAGVATRLAGDPDGALRLYAQALAVDPRFGPALNNSGLIHYERREWDVAIRYYEAALKLDPYYEKAHRNAGLAYLAKGDLQAAAQHFLAASQVRPEEPSNYVFLARILESRGHPDEAISGYLTSLRYRGDHVGEAHLRLARLYAGRRDWAAAVRHAEAARAAGAEVSAAWLAELRAQAAAEPAAR